MFGNNFSTLPKIIRFRCLVVLSNGAHGASDSLWAATVLDSLFVDQADLVIWEYAINDFRNPVVNIRTYLQRLHALRNTLPGSPLAL